MSAQRRLDGIRLRMIFGWEASGRGKRGEKPMAHIISETPMHDDMEWIMDVLLAADRGDWNAVQHKLQETEPVAPAVRLTPS